MGTNSNPYLSKSGQYNIGRLTVGFNNVIDPRLVQYDPWVILTVKANPGSINNSGTSKVDVDLNRLSNGSILSSSLPSAPLNLAVPWGSFTKDGINHNTLNTVNGVASAIFYANEGKLNPLFNPVRVTASTNYYTTDSSESAYITLNKASDLYLKLSGDKNPLNINEAFNLTYKLGNKLTDAAENVTVTLPLPLDFELTGIKGDGIWHYGHNGTPEIIWTFDTVTTGGSLPKCHR